jgi:hypothetical protein
MKKTILVLAATLFLAGCGLNPSKCKQNARDLVKHSEFYPISDYRYLFRDTLGNIIYVENMSQWSTEVTNVDTVFFAKH